MSQLPTYFISHGGGPWPYIPEMRTHFARTAEWLSGLPQSLTERPRAILSISGHWEEDEITVSTSESPPMVHDYSGFPPHTYSIKYSAPGSPALASRVLNLLRDKQITCHTDANRGFDHGTFVPLYLMYPGADIPTVSLSLKSGYDPFEHWRIGEALRPLRVEGVLIIGSGLTFHNLRMFGPPGAKVSQEFERWLTGVVEERDLVERKARLLNWESAPGARVAHPREDHLIPLMVCAGAASDQFAQREFIDRVWQIDMASYRFG